MNFRKYIKKLKKADAKEFINLVRENNEPNITGFDNGLYFGNDEVIVEFNNKDIYNYLKDIKKVELDFDKDDENFNEYLFGYYNHYEEEIDDYFILKNKEKYIEQLED